MRATVIDSHPGISTWRATVAVLRRVALAIAAAATLGVIAMDAAQAAPRDIVLMLDNSGSMRANDPEFLTRVAVRTFLEDLDGDNRVAVVSFDQRVNMLLPLTVLDDDSRDLFLTALDAINYAGQLTNSPAALERSLYELRISGRAQAEKSIIFMTDGIVDVAPEGPDDGDIEKARWMKSTLLEEAADSNVRIFGIAFTDNADFELIQTLARRTDGEYYRAYSTAEIEDVFRDLRDRLIDGNAPAGGVIATTPPAEQEPAPDSRASEVPAPADADASDIPPTVLAETDLPAVALPEVNIAGDAAAVPVIELPALATEPEPVVEPPAAEASPALDPAPAPPATVAAPPAPRMPAPPAAGDSPLLMVFAASGVVMMLALVALVIVLARRRPAGAASAGDSLMPKAYLNDIGGATEQQSYELDEKPTIVGRLMGLDADTANYVVIDESTVGRRHALLEYKEHSFWVADQNSLNGTFVNNRRIEAPTRLKHGDRIRFHNHEFEFMVLDMYETDRTMMSNTVYADVASGASHALDDADNSTIVRDDEPEPPLRSPSPEDPTITRH